MADELVGPGGKETWEKEGLLVSDFLKEIGSHIRPPYFASELKKRKKAQCKETGKRAYLKTQNHCLGFAYMKEDRLLMQELVLHMEEQKIQRQQNLIEKVEATRIIRQDEKKAKATLKREALEMKKGSTRAKRAKTVEKEPDTEAI